MKKRIYISIVASMLVTTGLQALDVDIKKGWNLVGISSNETINLTDFKSKIDLVTTYKDGKWGSYDPTAPEMANAFNSLSEQKGYWI